MAFYFSFFALLLTFLLITPPHSLGSSNQLLHPYLRQSSSTPTAQDAGGVTLELWCVAKNNAEDSALQTALDWACGPGAAACAPIQQGGACYDPSDIQRTASFAFNDYYLKHGITDGSCYFDNTAAVTSLNPSFNNCKFPSSLTVTNGNFSGSTTVGLGPASADLSCSNKIAAKWVWAFIMFPLFYASTLILWG